MLVLRVYFLLSFDNCFLVSLVLKSNNHHCVHRLIDFKSLDHLLVSGHNPSDLCAKCWLFLWFSTIKINAGCLTAIYVERSVCPGCHLDGRLLSVLGSIQNGVFKPDSSLKIAIFDAKVVSSFHIFLFFSSSVILLKTVCIKSVYFLKLCI